ncbi:MAG: Uma2 family endonuclease [Deltaproteobacteria bacterium]|nr:Uma2 family endonuclease [Deltaproteobacteria bacterium]
MGVPAKNEEQRFTYGDYLNWSDDERWELIDGVAYNMTPAPSVQHQRITGELFRQLANYLQGKPCEVFIAPFDVRLPRREEKDEDIDTVVQPDILVICDPGKLDEKGCRGGPDLVVEVVSPSTVQKDLKIKLGLYERVGVKEYWIFHPSDETVMVFTLGQNGRYGRPEILTKEDRLKTSLFDELAIDLNLIFSPKGDSSTPDA